ncbi:hypothetical protein H2200_001699 [Cladophialophora chaetospira]|uniref:Uncharacterized protein n=1 Tax=Cladophialophora chaetospira TaxID=386627 RepID=A0AA39CPB6_9EURO|nr:hypothetical protein H2200_001699 [Cladophialophora chaetospira]
MVSEVRKKSAELNTRDPSEDQIFDKLADCEADRMSASEASYKGRNPSESGRLTQFDDEFKRQSLQTKEITPNCDELSCADLDSVHDNGNPLRLSRQRRLKSIWMPYLAVVIPNLILPVALLCFVFGYKIDTGEDLFQFNTDIAKQHKGYYLVAFSVTRLAIISSCASTLAPFLTAPILLLWRVHTLRSFQKALSPESSCSLDYKNLPNFGMLLGLHTGSLDDLLKYLFQACAKIRPNKYRRQRRPPMSRPVHHTAAIAMVCIFIVICMWTADTVFHSLSNSVIIQTFDSSAGTTLSFGYAPTPQCQKFDRSNNLCLPCTWDLGDDISLLEFYTRGNEIFRLNSNVSEVTQIQPIGSDVSVLLPRSERISNRTDYKARTIGVAATCRPLTRTCNMKTMDVQTYTMFNCSDTFRGIIGKSPVSPTTQNFTILDPDTPPLDFKPSAYLQFGFYQDSPLSIPYNSVGWNVSADGWAVSAGDASTLPCPNDKDLPATVHMGVAGRFSASSAKAGVDLFKDPDLFTKLPIYSDFAFDCALEAYEVEYVWASGAVRNYTTRLGDAALLNMYIGQLSYFQQAASDDMTNDVLEMALQPDSQSMADTWAKLFSVRVLSTIGGYSMAVPNLQQQTRTEVLVAHVHIGSLWFLVGCGFATALFVTWITLRGLHLITIDPDILKGVEKMSFGAQLDERMGTTTNVSTRKEHAEDERPDAFNEKTECDLVGPERSFTGHSMATTIVPTASVARGI